MTHRSVQITFHLLFGSCFLYFSTAALSGTTVDNVVQSVLVNNLDIAISQESVISSEAAVVVEQGEFDWRVTGSAGYTRQEIQQDIDGLLSSGTVPADLWTTNLGFSKLFNNGVNISPNVSYFSSEDSLPDALSENLAAANINVNIPLLKNSGEDVVTARLRSSELSFEGEKLQHSFAISLSVSNAVQLFWNSLAAKKHLESLRRTTLYATEFSNNLKQLSDQGEITPMAYLSTKAELFLKDQEIQASQKLLNQSKRQLQFVMNNGAYSRTSKFELEGGFPLIPKQIEVSKFDEATWVKRALDNRSDMKALRLKLQSEISLSKLFKNGLLPDVDVDMDLDSIFLTYETALGNNDAKGKVTQNRALIRSYQLKILKLETIIENQVLQELDSIRYAIENYHNAIPSVNLYEIMNDDIQLKIKQGEASPNEYTVVQDKLAQANRRLILAQRNYANGIARLRSASGTVGVNDDLEESQITSRFMSI